MDPLVSSSNNGRRTSVPFPIDPEIAHLARTTLETTMPGGSALSTLIAHNKSDTFEHQPSPTPGSPVDKMHPHIAPPPYTTLEMQPSQGMTTVLGNTSTMQRRVFLQNNSDGNMQKCGTGGFFQDNVTLMDSSTLTRGSRTKLQKRQSNQVTQLSKENNNNQARWNAFRSVPKDGDQFDPKWTVLLAQGFKLFMYLLIHMCVLFGALACKMIVLLFMAQLNPQTPTYHPCRPFGLNDTMVPQQSEPRPNGHFVWFFWALWLAMSIPDVLTFVRCIRNAVFKWVPSPNVLTFLVSFGVETLRTVGYCLLVFVVMPSLDSVRAAMLGSAVAFVPAVLAMLTNYTECTAGVAGLNTLFDALAVIAQLSAVILWPFFDPTIASPSLYIVAVIFSSLHYWENYVSEFAKIGYMATLGRLKTRMQTSRYKIYLLLAPWKILLTWFMMVMSLGGAYEVHTALMSSNPFTAGLDDRSLSRLTEEDLIAYAFHENKTILLTVTLCVVTAVCYHLARFALKVKMDWFSYVVPTMCVLPFSVILSLVFCEAHLNEPCYFAEYIPDSVFFNCEYGPTWRGLFGDRMAWIWPLWFMSYVWLSVHVFTQKPTRLSRTDTLFVMPFYDSLFIEQSLTFNRRRMYADPSLEVEPEVSTMEDFESNASPSSVDNHNKNKDSTSKIYVCATMWHETRQEMKQMLKSIFRLDEDQCARKHAQKFLGVNDPDFYEMEAHIFFDDAWMTRESDGERVPNEFVRDMVGCVDAAASDVHGIVMQLRQSTRMDTPYGGRLMWTMPGDNRLYVHLKDKARVRHKKRWSQVMYMYYLLGHRIMDEVSDTDRKQLIADNTYILAIDGDSKFSPSAVQKLVDLMKKNVRMGAACGRIHPIGSGIMVWYQKFEYAIGHWFQKAAEHVFGCVLCSPGCFSLFRGSALMDDNVMHKYTKIATEAHHYVQYDQGEDRWLSTLLLKQGYRIEYAAASDAETYAPEGFDEFFNQRRRWTPSSVANTLDLLADFKKAVENNDSISRLYILYQMVVILFSMLGPAIIFTMMVFAQVAAFNMDAWTALWANAIPVCFFAVMCFVASSEAQLTVAKVFSVGYAFIMMAVLVGTGIQIAAEGLASPTSIYILFIISIFASSALLHPRESANIIYGSVFFLMIPSTYVILTLYSMINLNVINWGTREAAQKASGKDVSATVLERWMKKLRSFNEPAEDADPNKKSFLQGLCPCLFGRKDYAEQIRADAYRYQNERLARIDANLVELATQQYGASPPVIRIANATAVCSPTVDCSRLARHDQDLTSAPTPMGSTITPRHPSVVCVQQQSSTVVPNIQVVAPSPPPKGMRRSTSDPVFDATPLSQRVTIARNSLSPDSPTMTRSESVASSIGGHWTDETESPPTATALVATGTNGSVWMRERYLRRGHVDVLDESEHQFWTEFVKAYLKPLKRTPEEETVAVVGLRDLRDKIAFILLTINGLLVVIIYLLQVHKDLLSFSYTPYDNYTWQKWFPDKGTFELVEEPLQIEPIGFTIILFLSVILITQSIGMIMHRWHTLSHVLASTELSCFRARSSRQMEHTADEILNANAVEIVKNMQRLAPDDHSPADTVTPPAKKTPRGRPRKLIRDLDRAQNQKRTRGLSSAFQRRLSYMTSIGASGTPAERRRTLKLAGDRLNNVAFKNASPFMNRSGAKQAAILALQRRRESIGDTLHPSPRTGNTPGSVRRAKTTTPNMKDIKTLRFPSDNDVHV